MIVHSKSVPHRRIISLAPSVTSIFVALGARRDLVAVTRWCADVADVGNLPALGDCWAMETGSLARWKPTLIIGSVPYRSETVSRILDYPAPFLATNPRSLDDVFADILLLGSIVGRSAAALRLVAKIRRQFQTVGALTRHARPHPRVYAEAWPHPRISSPPWVAELIALAGGRMVVPPGERVSDSQIRRARPDIIVLAWTAAGDRARPAHALSNPAWRSVPAIRSRRVVVVPDQLLNTPGPPLVDGLHTLLQLFHPDLTSSSRTKRS